VALNISVALVILVITIVLSLAGLYGMPKIIERNLFRPYWISRRNEHYTFITSGLVHADLMHLIFNMVTFYFFAFRLEARIGGVQFAILYLIGLLASHIGTYFKQKDNPHYASLGASGAISAVLFAAIVYDPYQSLFIIPIPVPIPAPLFALGYLAYSWYAARNAQGRINHDAHFGGAIAGLLFVAVTAPGQYQNLLNFLGR
jgi:membrane associated rhomboid family serine protease